MIDHDQIIKTLIETFFQEFMELFCPREAALIDFRTVEFLKQEYFTDVTEGDRKQLDVVAKASLKGGGDEVVLIHGEHESSRKDRVFPMRMYLYYGQLFARYKKIIIPIALFTDDAKWRDPVPDHFEIGLSTKTFLKFDYYLIKLKHLDYRNFLQSNNPLAFALMAKMDYNAKERVRLKADFLRLILGTGINPAKTSVLIEFVDTYMPLNEPEKVEFTQLVRDKQDYEMVVKMITTYEQEGINKGIEQGFELGIEQGERASLVRQIEKKFGSIDQSQTQRILHELDQDRIRSLQLAVLDAKSLEDLGI